MAHRKRRTHGEGTVYQKRPGYWAAQVRIDGVRFTASGATADAARRGLAAKIDAAASGSDNVADARNLTVGEFFSGWIAGLRSTEAMKPSAWRRYESIVRLHLLPTLGDRLLADVGKRDVIAVLDSARSGETTGRQQTDTSLHHIHAVLRAGLQQAVNEEVLDRNVAKLVRAPAMRHRDKFILSAPEARQLLRAARGARLEAAIVLGIATGMREGEILGLRRQDVDFERGRLQVARNAAIGYEGRMELAEPKTRASRRVIQLPQVALEALREHLKGQDPPSLLVFPTRSGQLLSGTNFLVHHFHPVLVAAELPRMPFHDLRHSAGTLLKEMGVDEVTISEILGHASPVITNRLYGHVTPRLRVAAAEKMDAILRGDTEPNGSQMAANDRT